MNKKQKNNKTNRGNKVSKLVVDNEYRKTNYKLHKLKSSEKDTQIMKAAFICIGNHVAHVIFNESLL